MNARRIKSLKNAETREVDTRASPVFLTQDCLTGKQSWTEGIHLQINAASRPVGWADSLCGE